jgi:diguanylate cyclase (GGDEF)-like protein
MPKGALAQTKSVVPAPTLASSHARAPLDERALRGETARGPARSIPSELAALLGEIERLRAELADEQARTKALEASADTDPLTGIFNRRGFDRELKRSLAYVERYWTRAALFYVDLDSFKPVNDGHGHAAGDAVLKAVAATLTANVRASDTVARIGGDEFALVLWNLSEADAASKAWALEAAVAEAIVGWDGATLSVGASIGFAVLGPSDELGEVLARADHAMYQRKGARKSYRAASAPMTQKPVRQ